ncbi:MAG: hypothetical protein MZW92_70745 [Comamonadaceae bacterium]|nr:hypothetical protein [Comamonadaceae bacterium]
MTPVRPRPSTPPTDAGARRQSPAEKRLPWAWPCCCWPLACGAAGGWRRRGAASRPGRARTLGGAAGARCWAWRRRLCRWRRWCSSWADRRAGRRTVARGRSRGRERRDAAGACSWRWAEREWARARRYGTGAALLLVDIDRYLRLCDGRGAAAGDAVLAELLRDTARHAARCRRADPLRRRRRWPSSWRRPTPPARWTWPSASANAPSGWTPASAASALRITVSVGVAHLRPAHPNLQSLIDDAAGRAGRPRGRPAATACAPRRWSPAARAGRVRRDDRRTPRQQPRP